MDTDPLALDETWKIVFYLRKINGHKSVKTTAEMTLLPMQRKISSLVHAAQSMKSITN